MKTYEELKEEVEALETLISGGFFVSKKYDWKLVWSKIKSVTEMFRSTKFQNREERQMLWSSFQDIVSRVKNLQEDERAEWEKKRLESSRLLEEIKKAAWKAEPPNPLNDVILAIGTFGMSSIAGDILGPFNERKSELQLASEHLKEGWGLFRDGKDELLPRDRQEAYETLRNAQGKLDDAWSDYKQERQQAFDSLQREKEHRREEWKERIESQIENLESKRERLQEILSHKESHLSELREKYDEARSDSYRDRVSEWIDEEYRSIGEIEEKISNIEGWIQEHKSKL